MDFKQDRVKMTQNTLVGSVNCEWYEARYRPIGCVSNIAAVQTFVCPRWPLCVSREKFKGERVPTLQEAVEECINHQLTIFFDVKDQPDKVLALSRNSPYFLDTTGDLRGLDIALSNMVMAPSCLLIVYHIAYTSNPLSSFQVSSG